VTGYFSKLACARVPAPGTHIGGRLRLRSAPGGRDAPPERRTVTITDIDDIADMSVARAGGSAICAVQRRGPAFMRDSSTGAPRVQ